MLKKLIWPDWTFIPTREHYFQWKLDIPAQQGSSQKTFLSSAVSGFLRYSIPNIYSFFVFVKTSTKDPSSSYISSKKRTETEAAILSHPVNLLHDHADGRKKKK